MAESYIANLEMSTEFYTALDCIPDGIVVLCKAPDGTLVPEYTNEGFFNIYGVKQDRPNAAYTLDIFTLVHSADVQRVKSAFYSLKKSGDSLSETFRLYSHRGDIWVKAHASLTEKDSRQYIYCSFADVGSLMQSSLRASFNQNILDNLPAGCVVLQLFDEGGIRVLHIGRGFIKMCRLEEFGEARAMTAFMSVYHNDRQHVTGLFSHLKINGGYIDELHRLWRGGECFWAKVNAVLRIENGEQLVYACYQDITDAVESRQLLNTQEQLFDVIVDQSNVIYFQYDIKNDSAHFNRRAQRKFGVPESVPHFAESWLADTGMLHPDDKLTQLSAFKRLKNGSVREEFDVRLCSTHNNRWYWVHFVCTPLIDSDAKPSFIICTMEDVDEYKQLIDALMTALKSLHVECIQYDIENDIGIQSLNTRGQYGFWDLRIPDYTKHVIKNKIVHPDYTTGYLDMFRRLRAGEELVSFECPIKNLDNDSYTWKRTYFMVERDHGSAKLAVGTRINIAQEVAERQRFERELQYQKNLKAPNLVTSTLYNLTRGTVKHNFIVPDWAVPTCGSTDYETDIAFLLTLTASPEQREELSRLMDREALLKSCAQGECAFTFEGRLNRKDGGGAWVRMELRLTEDPVTKDVIAFASWFDINRQKLTELALDRIALDNYDYVGVIDHTNGRFIILYSSDSPESGSVPPEASDDFYADTAHRVSELKERGLFVDEKDYLATLENTDLKNVLAHLEVNGRYSFIVRRLSEVDGRIAFFRMEYLFADETKTLMLIARSNITAIVQDEQHQQERLQLALDREQKANRAKSDFLSNMSHDIRTPLNSIINLIGLLRSDIDDRELLLSSLKKLELSGDFLLGLINDILDMSRIESGHMELHPEVYSLREAIDYVNSVIVPLCREKGISFTHDEVNDYPNVLTDKVRLNQLFFNLLSNAVKYTDSGGIVHLGIEAERLENNTLSCNFVISDNGCGMSPNFIEKAFTPFEQENDIGAYTGTGLGLPISKAIVDKMGGTIRIQSKLKRGTSVFLHLDMPIVDHKELLAHQDDESRLEQPSEKLKGMRILVVEDHHVNREIVIRLLKRCGCEPDSAENGEQALEMFICSGVSYYGGILMDIRMPVMNGLEAAKAIRALPRTDAAEVPIIAMTANIFTEDVKSSFAAGMNAHLNKPIEPRKLYRALNEYCCGMKL